MKPIAVFLIGQPGAGKSTIVNRVLKGHALTPYKHGKIKAGKVEGQGVVVVGDYSDKEQKFPGTDRLSMSAITDWKGFLEATSQVHENPHILMEGARLANDRAIRELAEAGWEPKVILIDVSERELEARRAKRGAHPKETWLKTMHSIVHNLAERQGAETLGNMDGDEGIESAAIYLRELLGWHGR